jgi:hypothetical protein
MWELRIFAVVGLVATAILTTLVIIAGFALARVARRWYHAALRRGRQTRSQPSAFANGRRYTP